MNTLFTFISLLVQNNCRIFFLRKKEEKWAAKVIRDLENELDGALDNFIFKKIVERYAVFLLIVCDAFAQLKGRNTNKEEKRRILYFCICSVLFDNFCDSKDFAPEQLFRISFHHETYDATNISEKIFLYAHTFLLKKVRNKEEYLNVSRLLFQAQIDSDKQFQSAVSDEELETITKNKGGYSLLLSAYYFDETFDDIERNCWFLLGYLYQLVNDLYDIYKDLQEGSETLPNRINDAEAFGIFYEKIVTELSDNIAKMKTTEKRKKRFYFSMMNVCSFGAVAINQLKNIRKKHNGRLPNLH
ncbi:MAG: hypothetical protein LBE82_02030, partial [Chitinophagaceae bacterium]|nr:hypothetical protein [Chitinophagaceae bacterium]